MAQPRIRQPRSPFMSGLLGGLIGAGLGGLLFGGGFFGHGLGFGGFLGFLLQIFLIVMLGRFLWRLFTGNRSPALAGGPGLFARGGPPQQGPHDGRRRGASPIRAAADHHRARRLPGVRAVAAGQPGRLERA